MLSCRFFRLVRLIIVCLVDFCQSIRNSYYIKEYTSRPSAKFSNQPSDRTSSELVGGNFKFELIMMEPSELSVRPGRVKSEALLHSPVRPNLGGPRPGQSVVEPGPAGINGGLPRSCLPRPTRPAQAYPGLPRLTQADPGLPRQFRSGPAGLNRRRSSTVRSGRTWAGPGQASR